jgi:hypothetical protein
MGRVASSRRRSCRSDARRVLRYVLVTTVVAAKGGLYYPFIDVDLTIGVARFPTSNITETRRRALALSIQGTHGKNCDAVARLRASSTTWRGNRTCFVVRTTAVSVANPKRTGAQRRRRPASTIATASIATHGQRDGAGSRRVQWQPLEEVGGGCIEASWCARRPFRAGGRRRGAGARCPGRRRTTRA